jgi:hypothetical protein
VSEAAPPGPERPPLPPSAPAAESGGWPYLPSVNADCFEPIGRTNAPPTKTTIADAVKAAQPIEYQSDAYVVFRGACHFGAKKSSSECRPFVVLSDTRYAGIKAAMTPTLDLVVFVDDSSKWEQFSKHRVNFGLCSFEPGAMAARVIGTPTAL